GGGSWTNNAISAQTSNEAGGYAGDYLEYIGLAMRDGTGHAFWASRHGVGTDLDAFTTTIGFVSATNSNVLTVTGDETGVVNDTTDIRISPTNSNYLEVSVNGVLEYDGVSLTLDSIVVNGLGGNDTIFIDTLPGGVTVTVNGGNNDDALHVTFP